jgi:type VI protein secretion system component VasA
MGIGCCTILRVSRSLSLFLDERVAACLPPMEGNRFEIVFLLKQANAALEPLIDVDNFAHCTPVVNLFQRTSDRIPVTNAI